MAEFCVLIQYVSELVIVVSCDTNSCRAVMCAATSDTDAYCIVRVLVLICTTKLKCAMKSALSIGALA